MNTKHSLNKNRVLVAMSGGVDSSVALLKILEAGYDAFGVTMKLWESRNSNGNLINDSYCCSLDAVNNAKQVCQTLQVPHYTIDFQDVFREQVVDYFIEEYFAGRTPNPCIQCNSHVRWGALLNKANQLDSYWIATGHYARMDKENDQIPFLRKALDSNKDQTYVLWEIDQHSLKRTLFPLGDLMKKKVRELAANANFATAEVKESMELCFIPNNNYRGFMEDYVPDKISEDSRGDFINTQEEFLGKHSGISHYTIGQRRRLGITGPKASYVQNIDSDSKIITLAPREKMFFTGCTVNRLNWHCDISDFLSKPITVHIRYRHKGVTCYLLNLGDKETNVNFDTPQFAVAPGQSAVFYSEDRLLGGGIITKASIHE